MTEKMCLNIHGIRTLCLSVLTVKYVIRHQLCSLSKRATFLWEARVLSHINFQAKALQRLPWRRRHFLAQLLVSNAKETDLSSAPSTLITQLPLRTNEWL
jgi:hypothetical protein